MVKKQTKLWNPAFISICIVGFLTLLGASVGNALLSKKASSLGASSDTIGLINSVASVSALLFLPLSAPFLDYFKKKYVYAFVTMLSAITLLGNGLTNSIPAMMVLTFINGIGKAVSGAASLAMVSDTIPDDEITTGVTYFTIAQVASQAFGPSLGLALNDQFGYSLTFIISAIMVFVSIIMVMMLPTSEVKQDRKFHFSLQGTFARAALSPAIMMAFIALAYSTVNSFLIVYADTIPLSNIGLYFTVNTFAIMISRPLVTKLLRFIDEKYVVVSAIVFTMISLLLISIGTNIVIFIIAAIFAAFGYGSLQPMIQAMCINSVGPESRGAASSTSFVGTNIGYLVGPTLGGIIANQLGYSSMFQLMNISLAVSIVIYFMFVKNRVIYTAE